MTEQIGRWIDLARKAFVDLLDRELALGYRETEARLSENSYDGSVTFDPHILTMVIQQLLADGTVIRVEEPTRGGTAPVTIEPTNRHRRGTRIDQSSRRKRLLIARYNGWSTGDASHHGIIGPAGERSVRLALAQASGVAPLMPGAGEVRELMGVRLDGALDSAAYLVVLDDRGVPQVVTLMIEVKNIRSWIYPTSPELYQLLSKAVRVQQANPTAPMLPVLVCRRAHRTLMYMAKDLGFFVIETKRQPIGSTIDPGERAFLEVRNELMFTDLVPGLDAEPAVLRRIPKLPGYASTGADLWRATSLHTDMAGEIIAARRNTRSTQNVPHRDRLEELAVDASRRGDWR